MLWCALVLELGCVASRCRRPRVHGERRPKQQSPSNHARFVAVDHQYLIVTSANFSKSAERHNVELGLVITDPIVTQAVEGQLAALERAVYERVPVA